MTDTASTATQDQEVSLWDQIRFVTYGHSIADVMLVGIVLVEQCLVQRSNSKKQALRALDAFYIKMAEEIDSKYEQLRADGVTDGRPS
jgi:hypothetical protein